MVRVIIVFVGVRYWELGSGVYILVIVINKLIFQGGGGGYVPSLNAAHDVCF